jgi:putative redox protein
MLQNVRTPRERGITVPRSKPVTSGPNDGKVTVTGSAAGFVQHVSVGAHQLVADEPEAAGGTDRGPSPYALLLAALGSCTSMTIGMYARRKRWPLENVTVWLRHQRKHVEDCEDCDEKERFLTVIEREIALDGPLSPEQRARLLEIAEKCPVHRTLTSEIQIHTRLTEPA